MNARDLSNRLAELLHREHHAMADFLLALADFDRLRAWETLGHASMFAFLRRELRLSAGAAQYRKTAAELVQRHPEVERALRSGELCLSSIVELAKVITPDNVTTILPRFFGLSRREAADVAVSIRPVANPPVREIVTAVRSRVNRERAASVEAAACPAAARNPVRPAEPELAVVATQRAAETRAPGGDAVDRASLRPAELEPANGPLACPGPPATRPSTVEPLDAGHVRLHLTVSRRLVAKLAAAKDALSHVRPGAPTEEILEAALDLLLRQHAKRKAAAVKTPRAAPAKPADTGSRHVPAAVRREVWARDQGRCTWPLDSGGTCGSTHRLELDHVTPVALGGASTVANLRVLCERHNRLAARRIFGDAWMDRYARPRPAALPLGAAARDHIDRHP